MCVCVFSTNALSCSAGCRCPQEAFNPVCGSDGVEFRSPCHAGCIGIETDINNKTKVRITLSFCTFETSLSHSRTNTALTKTHFVSKDIQIHFKFMWCSVTENQSALYLCAANSHLLSGGFVFLWILFLFHSELHAAETVVILQIETINYSLSSSHGLSHNHTLVLDFVCILIFSPTSISVEVVWSETDSINMHSETV